MSAPGKRAAVRTTQAPRITPMVAVAIAAPVVSLLALVIQAPADRQAPAGERAPGTRPLTAQALACPAGDGALVVGSGAQGGGDGSLRRRVAGTVAPPTPVDLPAGGQDTIPSAPGAVVFDATGTLAPSLYAARLGKGERPAAGECVPAVGERWFVGVGSGGDHTSTLQLVNPDTGPAVADVTLWSTDGALDRIESRGLTIPGGGTTTLDLEALAPHRNELAMRVSVSRGRVAATVQDTFAPGGGVPTSDGLPTTAPPATSVLVPGLLRTAQQQVLVLVNPGETEGRVALKVVGARSTFSPTGVPEIRVPAGRVVVTDLTKQLAGALASEDGSLSITSTVPVSADVRSVLAGDVVHHVGVGLAPGAAAAVVPPGGATTLVVDPGETAGTLRVTFLGPRGSELESRLLPGSARSFPVPAGTVAVLVTAKVEFAAALRTVGARGAALLPLRPLVDRQLVPAVAPAWPPQSGR